MKKREIVSLALVSIVALIAIVGLITKFDFTFSSTGEAAQPIVSLQGAVDVSRELQQSELLRKKIVDTKAKLPATATKLKSTLDDAERKRASFKLQLSKAKDQVEKENILHSIGHEMIEEQVESVRDMANFQQTKKDMLVQVVAIEKQIAAAQKAKIKQEGIKL